MEKFRKYFRKKKIEISQMLSNNKIMKLYFLYVNLMSDCLERKF